MPKQKTHKGLSKRVKITGGGKVRRQRCCGSHLMSSKNAKRRRRIGSTAIVNGLSAKTTKGLLGK
ncbi:MAG: 50S ribosomal protein L35 [Planctomycetota bacterium]|nr:MAG: 50S ribosomal protein L35 [Planctomycetota bacterium]